MTTARAEVLLVGPDFKVGQTLPDRLCQWGFRCHFAGTARMASGLLGSQQVDLVLTMTHLPDESGFRLVTSLSPLVVTAFLCLPVEHSCFWLPAMDCGRNCWGSPALRPAQFAHKLEELSRRSPVPEPAGSLTPQCNNLQPWRYASTREKDAHEKPYSREQEDGYEEALTASRRCKPVLI